MTFSTATIPICNKYFFASSKANLILFLSGSVSHFYFGFVNWAIMHQ